MSIHFAAANSNRFSAANPAATQKILAKAQEFVANDNWAGADRSDRVLRAALHHFAQHGLGAAKVARAQAERAFFNGDRDTYDWWLGITRTLDRRMAESVSGQSGNVKTGVPRLMK